MTRRRPDPAITSAALDPSKPTDREVADAFGVTRSAVGQRRRRQGDRRKPGRRPGPCTCATTAGREALAVLVGIAERKGWAVTELLVWIDENAPRRK